MSIKRTHIVLFVSAAVSFAVGYGALAEAAFPYFNRQEFRGYFLNNFDSAGNNVWPTTSTTAGCPASGGNAMPSSVDTAAELISFVECKLNSTNGTASIRQQERTGAAFIIQTMIGTATNRPPTAAQIAEWEARVNYSASQGWITWSLAFNYGVNSLYQGYPSPDDDAFYNDGAASGNSIVFRGPGGFILYGIRRQCANPVGSNSFQPITNNPDFAITGDSDADKATVAPGDTVRFTHSLTSSAATSPASINWTTQDTLNGNATVDSGNAGTFTAGETKAIAAATEDYIVPLGAPPGSQICRRISFTPSSGGGGTATSTQICATVAANFNLTPLINVQINGGSVVGNRAEPGDTVTFTYVVTNSSSGGSTGTACTIYGLSRNGYYAIPTPIDSVSDGGYIQPAHGCPRDFPGNSSTTLGGPETAAPATVVANRTICRSLFVNPGTSGGPPVGTEVCVYVTAKPYTRIYGGDIIAGGGVETAPGVCATNSGAAIIGWNKRSPTYSGAGVQLAAYALSTIADFATASNTAGSAVTPTGLAFGNTATNATNGNFGGSLGSAPCIPNHYATRPATTSAIPASVASMVTGAYGGTGNFSLAGGAVNAPNRVTVYVDGNLFISSNITYGGAWNSGNIPMFRVIVRGNIFIDNDVSQLDGLYIAQPNGLSGGIIYTCAQNASPFTPMVLDGSLATQCDNAKLTVNGGFVAKQVHLLRTIGTLSQASGSGEVSTSGSIAETFNYSPIMWMPQPPLTEGGAVYDAITTLPPVL
jgi:hypothetical protein